jgi:hypothetical protein
VLYNNVSNNIVLPYTNETMAKGEYGTGKMRLESVIKAAAGLTLLCSSLVASVITSVANNVVDKQQVCLLLRFVG